MFIMIVCSFWPLFSSIVYCWSFSHIWLFETHGCSLPCSSVHEILQARTLLTSFTLSSLFCYVISIFNCNISVFLHCQTDCIVSFLISLFQLNTFKFLFIYLFHDCAFWHFLLGSFSSYHILCISHFIYLFFLELLLNIILLFFKLFYIFLNSLLKKNFPLLLWLSFWIIILGFPGGSYGRWLLSYF